MGDVRDVRDFNHAGEMVSHLRSTSVRTYLMSKREWHDYQAQTEISKCQGCNEPVLDSIETVLGGDGNDDQHVANHDDDHHDGDDDGQDDDLCVTVLARVAQVHFGV